MRKILSMTVAALVAVALAAPAWAVEINGFAQINGWMSNGRDGFGNFVTDKDSDKSNSYVEQRARLKFGFGDENVKFVYQNEIDALWGSTTMPSGKPSAGSLGTDSINVETKHAYLWFKGPMGVDVTAGLVGLDDPYAGIIYSDDMAAVAVHKNFGAADVTVAWAKFAENRTDKADDVDLYFVRTVLAPAKDMSLGLNLHYLKSRAGVPSGNGALGLWIPGVDFTGSFGPAKINAFAFLQNGKLDYQGGGTDVKFSGMAAGAHADVAAGKGTAFLEALYISGDNQNDDKFKGVASVSPWYGRSGMQILTANNDDLNSDSGAGLAYDPTLGGLGILLVGGGYDMKVSDKLGCVVAAGYAQVAKAPTGMKKDLGTEFNTKLTYNVQKGLDLKLGLAYLLTGKAFGEGANEKADIWQVGSTLAYSF